MSEDIWILGIYMTKFGKHPELDTVDLAAEAAQAALADGGVTMKDIGVLAAGNLMGGGLGIGQALQKQIGQTGIPVYNVSNASRDRRHRVAHRDHGDQGGRVRHGPRGRGREAGRPGLLSGGRVPRTPTGRHAVVTARSPRSTVASAPTPCRACSRRSVWSTATSTAAPASSCSADLREEPLALHAEPARRVLEEDEPRRHHERRDDRLPEHTADVLGELRRRRGRGRRLRLQVEDAEPRAAAPRGEGLGIRAHHRPVAGGVPGAPGRQHADSARGRAGVRSGRDRPVRPRPGRAARLLRHRRARPLRQPHAVRAGRRRRLLRIRRDVAGRLDPGQRLGRARVEGAPDRGNGHRQHLGGLLPPTAAKPATARSKAPASASRTSSASAPRAGCTSSNAPPDPTGRRGR